MSAAPKSFRSAAAFRAWLAKHHASKPELTVRLFKTSAAHLGMGYVDALDEALCWGWIDGVKRAYDEVSFTHRFTPRRPRSIWSRVNVKKVEALIAAKRMAPPGMAAFEARTEERTGIYSFERAAMQLTPAYERAFRANKNAWAFFQALAPGYRRLLVFRVMSAKQEATRERRLAGIIAKTAKGINPAVLG